MNERWKFRFHTGSIKRGSVMALHEANVDGFDSILVRLKDQVVLQG